MFQTTNQVHYWMPNPKKCGVWLNLHNRCKHFPLESLSFSNKARSNCKLLHQVRLEIWIVNSSSRSYLMPSASSCKSFAGYSDIPFICLPLHVSVFLSTSYVTIPSGLAYSLSIYFPISALQTDCSHHRAVHKDVKEMPRPEQPLGSPGRPSCKWP